MGAGHRALGPRTGGLRILLMVACAVAACWELEPLANREFAKQLLALRRAQRVEGEETAPGTASAHLTDRFRTSRSAVRLTHQLTR